MQLGKFRSGDGRSDHDQQRDGREPRPQPQNDGQAAGDLDEADDGSEERGMGDADLREAADAKGGGRNFWIPSETKTQPTRIRMRMMARVTISSCT